MDWLRNAIVTSGRALCGFCLSPTGGRSRVAWGFLRWIPPLCLLLLFLYGFLFYGAYGFFASFIKGIVAAALAIRTLLGGIKVFPRSASLIVWIAWAVSAVFIPFNPVSFAAYIVGGILGWFLEHHEELRGPAIIYPALSDYYALTFVFWFLASGIWETDLYRTRLLGSLLNACVAAFYTYSLRYSMIRTTVTAAPA